MLPGWKINRERIKPAYDANYRELIVGILTQAIRDYAFKPEYRSSIGRFFDSTWCATLCEESDFPREILKQREGIIEAGKRLRGKRTGRKSGTSAI